MAPIISTSRTTALDAYISILKLAEYMQANSTRRRQIIKSLKEDKDFKKSYYSSVRNILELFVKTGYDKKLLNKTIANLKAKTALTSWKEDKDIPNSILALESLDRISLPNLSDYEVTSTLPHVKSIELVGLPVTIKPDVYLVHKVTGKFGLIKFHLAKTESNRLCSQGLQYAATLLKYSLIEYGILESQIDSAACIAVDVFNEEWASAPKAYKRSINSLEAACEEILDRWPSL